MVLGPVSKVLPVAIRQRAYCTYILPVARLVGLPGQRFASKVGRGVTQLSPKAIWARKAIYVGVRGCPRRMPGSRDRTH